MRLQARSVVVMAVVLMLICGAIGGQGAPQGSLAGTCYCSEHAWSARCTTVAECERLEAAHAQLPHKRPFDCGTRSAPSTVRSPTVATPALAKMLGAAAGMGAIGGLV